MGNIINTPFTRSQSVQYLDTDGIGEDFKKFCFEVAGLKGHFERLSI
jgi:hypothetical protein